jgi:sugar phosphate isomerase/epimerase
MQIGVQVQPTQPLPVEIEWCVRHRFTYVDIPLAAPGAALESTDWRAIAALLEDAELPAVCQSAAYLPVDNPSPLVRQAALDELRRSVDATARIGAPLLSVPWIGWPGFMSESDGYLYSQQWLTILINHAQTRNIEIALINSTQNRHQLKHFRQLFHRVPGLRLTYDIGHGNIGAAKSTTRDYLFAFTDRLALIHASDNDGEADLHLPFGAPQSGGISLPQELRTLRSFRYDGRITLQILGDRHWLLATRDILAQTWESAN